MYFLKKIFPFCTFLILCSCNREKVIDIEGFEEAKFVVSTDYDSFEDHEVLYYELITNRDKVLIGKTWLACTGYRNIDLDEFRGERRDSFIFLKWKEPIKYPVFHGVPIITIYDLKSNRELK